MQMDPSDMQGFATPRSMPGSHETSAVRQESDNEDQGTKRLSSPHIAGVHTGLPFSRAQLQQQIETKDRALSVAFSRMQVIEKQVL